MPPDARPTRPTGIRDVAQRAGVSLGTASNALNGTGRISNATRQKVLDVAQELNYSASIAATQMRLGRSGVIGIYERKPAVESGVLQDIEFVFDLVRACCTSAWEKKLYPVLLPTDIQIDTLAAFPLDGVIIIDPVPSDPVLANLTSRGIPTVTMGRDSDRQSATWWVDNDKRQQCVITLEHFAQHGAQRTTLITAPTGQSYLLDNVAAFTDWLERHPDITGQVIEIAPKADPGTIPAMARSLVSTCHASDGIYITVDALVTPIVNAALEQGRRIPDDLQIATSTLSRSTSNAPVSILSFDLRIRALGRELVSLLVRRISGEEPDTVIVAAETIVTRATNNWGLRP